MKYLDQETNLRRIQLEREITLTDAEEEAIKLVMNEEVKRGIVRKDMKSDERFEQSLCEAKFNVAKTVIKHDEPSLLRPEALPFTPLMLPIREAASQDNNFTPERDKPTTHQEATFKQIVSL